MAHCFLARAHSFNTTIVDCIYMSLLLIHIDTFVSGVHGNEECNHVIQLSQLALQLMLAIENLSEMDLGGVKDFPQVRVGLHTGG